MLVRLSGPRAVLKVHRVVAMAWLPNPDSLPVVNHIDCDPRNNNVENLEWCTQPDNIRHSKRLGRYPDNHWSGRRSPNANLTDADASQVREMYETGEWSHERLGKHLGISKRTVFRIVKGESYVPERVA